MLGSKYIKVIKRYIIITFGIILTSYPISAFLIPNKIVSGGISGVSTILYYLFGMEPGISFFLMNAILLIMALFFIGKDFVAKTIYGAVSMSLFVQLFSYLSPITEDPFLATIFGAIINGIGIGIVLSQGASTAGTDIIGRLLQLLFPNIKIGSLLIVLDGAVIAVSLAIFRNWDLTLYGIVALFLCGISINFVIHKLNVARIAFVVTSEGVLISSLLLKTLSRGITLIDAIGAYTNENKYVLICALKDNELPEFQKKVHEIDKGAFIIFSEAQGISGNGFKLYK